MPSELKTERRDATLILTLSDPATRNSLSAQALIAGVEALNVAADNPEIRCAVLRGDGANFCSGGDIQRLVTNRGEGGADAQREQLERVNRFIEALRTFPKPVIAAVEGSAAGAGFTLALACDLIVAAEDARFIMSHGRIGLSPDGGGTWHLMQMVPRQLALQMIWLAEPMRARQMQTWGLVNAVTDTGGALEEALVMAGKLAAMAPNAIASVKELVSQWPRAGLSQQLALEAEHFLDNLAHDNAGHGIAGFLERRPPSFE
ncbi:MAG: enoyl-CoA hydratase [Rhizobacter sp.]|nr:enoyl-CoA hydratase [Rhizobacter sp.]